MLAGRAAQRARSAAAAARFEGAKKASAAIRRAGCEREREAANDAVQPRRLRALVGEPGQGVVVPYERVLICLTAYYRAGGALKLADAEADDRTRARFAATVSDLSEKTVRALVRRWEDTGELPVEAPGVRGAAAAAYERWERLPDDARAAVERHVMQNVTVNQQPFSYTRQVLKVFLEDEYGADASLRVCGRLLFRWGFEYGDYAREQLGGSRPARMVAKQIHLVQLDNAIKKKHVIMCLDETYANIRLAYYRGYAPAGNRAAAAVPKCGGLGDRICYVNAVGEAGLLVGGHARNDESGAWTFPVNGDTQPDALFGGELMFEAASGAGDYHGAEPPRARGGWCAPRCSSPTALLTPHRQLQRRALYALRQEPPHPRSARRVPRRLQRRGQDAHDDRDGPRAVPLQVVGRPLQPARLGAQADSRRARRKDARHHDRQGACPRSS